jgi:hypothetical protein
MRFQQYPDGSGCALSGWYPVSGKLAIRYSPKWLTRYNSPFRVAHSCYTWWYGVRSDRNWTGTSRPWSQHVNHYTITSQYPTLVQYMEQTAQTDCLAFGVWSKEWQLVKQLLKIALMATVCLSRYCDELLIYFIAWRHIIAARFL